MADSTTPDAGMLSSWYDSYKASNPTTSTTTNTPAVATTQAAAAAPVTNWNVGNNQTVQGQLSGMLSTGSPLMDRAATTAKQQSAAKGLLNSTMAVQAGQAALYDAALPVAQADANTYAAAAKTNADAANTSAAQAAGFQQQANVASAGATNDAATQQRQLASAEAQANNDIAARTNLAQQQANSDAMLRTTLAQMDADKSVKIAQMDAATRQQLAQIEAQYKTQLQTSQSGAAMYQQMTDNITRIMLDTTLDGPAKQAAINNTVELYRNALGMQQAVSGLNLGEILGANVLSAPTGSSAVSGASAAVPSPSPANQAGQDSTQGAGGPGGSPQ